MLKHLVWDSHGEKKLRLWKIQLLLENERGFQKLAAAESIRCHIPESTEYVAVTQCLYLSKFQ